MRVIATTLALRLPHALSRAVAFPDGSSALLAGGLTDAGTVATILRITLPNGPIAVSGRLPAPVHDAGGAFLGTTPLVLGGGNVAPEAIVQDLTDTVGQLPLPRADLSAVELDGRLFVVGGGTPARLDTAVLATTDGAHFDRIATLRLGVRYPAVAVVGGSIIVVGGTDGVTDRPEIQAIDPAIGAVRLIGRLPRGLSHAAAVVVGGHLIVAGGRTDGRAQDAIWDVDPATGSVLLVGHLPVAVSDAAVVVVDGVAFLLGGEGSARVASIIEIRLG